MQEIFNKNLEEVKESQSIMNNAINEIKKHSGGIKRNEDNLRDLLGQCEMPQHANHRSPRRRQKERP